MSMVYVLTFEYNDKSGFHVCGVTPNRAVAAAWYNANDDSYVYEIDINSEPNNWITGHKRWIPNERT
jgi:hypothetical protein